METEKKVVDASVVAKWFLNEQGSDEALKLRDDHIACRTFLIVPELAFLEVLNALRYKGQDADALKKANNALWDAQLHVEKLNSFLLEKAAQAALKHNSSLYDAVYVALANKFGVPLITADKALRKTPNAVLL